MKNSKYDTEKPSFRSKDLDLPKVFPENNDQVLPLSSDISKRLPPSQEINLIPLPNRSRPPRILIADDDTYFFDALQRSMKNFYPGKMDLRFWAPDNIEIPDLLEILRQYQQEGWKPDAIIIDINFDRGGKHGVDYLNELRQEHG